jgi:hypothetical protein
MLQRIAEAESNLELVMTKHELAPWSYSKLKTLEKCPLQFYLQYLLKIRPDKDVVINTDLADAGTAAHRILELVILGNTVSESFRLAKIELCNVDPNSPHYSPRNPNLSEELWEAKVNNNEASIISFSERMQDFERNNKVLKKLTELRVAVTKDWLPTTFFAKNVYFRGIIDLILFIDTGEGFLPDSIILDHKNYSEVLFTESLRNFDTQLMVYKIMAHKAVQPISGAQAGINFIRAGKTIIGEYTDASEIENKLVSKLEFLLSGAVDSVKEGYGYFKHIAGSACNYCDFAGPCKNGSLKEVELGTKKYFPVFWAAVEKEKQVKADSALAIKEKVKADKAEAKRLLKLEKKVA